MKRAATKRANPAATEPGTAKGESGPAGEDVGPDASPEAPVKKTVTVRLAGKEYRLRSDSSEKSLQEVASYVDKSMQMIKDRTDTVDSQDAALLTALNVAREVLQLRQQLMVAQDIAAAVSDARIRSVIEQIEAALPPADSAAS